MNSPLTNEPIPIRPIKGSGEAVWGSCPPAAGDAAGAAVVSACGIVLLLVFDLSVVAAGIVDWSVLVAGAAAGAA